MAIYNDELGTLCFNAAALEVCRWLFVLKTHLAFEQRQVVVQLHLQGL